MEKNSLTKAMKNSISNVLEKMFFLPLEMNESREANTLTEMKSVICSRLEFTGDFSGYFLFYTPKNLANSITADFLGIDEQGISDEKVTETLKEITNMIAGNTFAQYDDNSVFNLGIPEVITNDSSGANHSENEIIIFIDTPEDQMALKLTLTGDK